MKRVLGAVLKADRDFAMIQPQDAIAVAYSGGKDSALLLKALKMYQRFSKHAFHLEAITIDTGFENMDFACGQAFCDSLGIPYTIVKTQIKEVVFDIRKEKNPCALCAKMRRGILADTAKNRGLNKIAFGHQADDAIATFFLSLFYEGRLSTFKPVTYLDRSDITTIRPLLYATEAQVIDAVRRHKIPVIKSTCPMDKHTRREYANDLVKTLSQEIPHFRGKVLTALMNEEQVTLWKKAPVDLR